MLKKPSSCVNYVCGLLILLCFLTIKLNQNVIDVKVSSTRTAKLVGFVPNEKKRIETNVPLTKLLNLPTKFKFLLKPERTICDKSKKLLIFIHSKIDHFDARDEIRSTWGSTKLQQKLNYRLVFLIGLPKDENQKLEQQIRSEHELNDDLIRGNFVDAYRNLTYKHVMGYKWVLHYCANVNFVMKSDDDAFVNIFAVIDLLNVTSRDGEQNHKSDYAMSEDYIRPNYDAEIEYLTITKKDKKSKKLVPNRRASFVSYKKILKSLSINSKIKFIACALLKNGTKVKRTGKWRLTYEEYAIDYFPPYCSGIAYFLNLNALRSIYNHVHKMKRILFIDDLFLTGIVIQQQTNYSNYLNDPTDYSRMELDLSKPTKKSEYSNDAYLIVDWSEFYNYRWQKFMNALAQKDNGFNSVVFINDLDKMPNRMRLVKIAWQMIEGHYQIH